MLKEILSVFRKKELQPIEIHIGDIEVKLKNPHELPVFDVENNRSNLEFARTHGIEAVSFKDVIDQIGRDTLEHIVLFDTAPGHVGNHWVVSQVDDKNRHVELKLCSALGGHVYGEYYPMQVPLETEMFTGISIQHNSINGERISLSEFSLLITSSESSPGLKNHDWNEQILWANSEKNLVSMSEHPAFNK